MIVDDAPYEAVVAMLASFDKNGIDDVFVIPPFFGTSPSSSVSHWIRFLVDGLVNHPFPMVLISTESFRTWRESLILLSNPDFRLVDRFIVESMGNTGEECITSTNVKSIPLATWKKEHRLFFFEHDGTVTKSCLLPDPAASCEFLSKVIGLDVIHWKRQDLVAIRSVAGEIGCHIGSSQ